MRLHPDTVSTTTEDGLVLLNQRTGRYWQLNRSGATTLERLLAGETIAEIAEDIAGRANVERPRVHRDITEMTDRLVAAGLVARR